MGHLRASGFAAITAWAGVLCALLPGGADAQQGAINNFRVWDADENIVIDTDFQSGETLDTRVIGDCLAIEAMPNAYLAVPSGPGSVAFALDGAPIDCSSGPGLAYENNVPYVWEEHVANNDPLCADSLRIHGQHTLTAVPYDEDDCLGAAGAMVSVTFDVIARDSGRCAPAICGDGILQEGEACDDGNNLPGDGCTDLGEIEPGFVCFGEPSVCCEQTYVEADRAFYVCDSPSRVDTAIASCESLGGRLARITSQTVNDGVTVPEFAVWIDGTDAASEDVWLYDDGTPVTFFNWQPGEPDGATGENCIHLLASGVFADLRCEAALRFACEIPLVLSCGDGILDPGEECDDGNQNDEDGCTTECLLTMCGNGMREANEACDDGNVSNTDGCLNGCVAAVCGDGFVWDGVEACDDGNTNDADACSNTCTWTTLDGGGPRSGSDGSSGGCGVVSHRPSGVMLSWCAAVAIALLARRRR